MPVTVAWRAALFASTTALACACSLTTSFDGLTGGTPPGGGDALPDGATSDAVTSDAPTSDAATDASAEASVPFCKAAAHDFCADFDEGKAPDYNWTYRDLCTTGCALQVDTDVAVQAPSPPGTLHLSTPAGASSLSGPNVLRVGVARKLSTVNQSARLAFRVRVDAVDAITAQIASLSFVAGSNDYVVDLQQGSTGAYVMEEITPSDGGPTRYPETPLPRGLTAGVWSQVDLLFTVGPPPTLTVTIDAGSPSVVRLDPGAHGGSITVTVELAYYTPMTVTASSLHVDDVAVDLQ